MKPPVEQFARCYSVMDAPLPLSRVESLINTEIDDGAHIVQIAGISPGVLIVIYEREPSP